MDLAGLNVDEVASREGVDLAVNHNVNLTLEDVEVLLHDVVVVGLEILAWLELDHGIVHARALHQVLRAVISAPILKIVLVDNKHLAFLSGATCTATKRSFCVPRVTVARRSPGAYRPGALHMLLTLPSSASSS